MPSPTDNPYRTPEVHDPPGPGRVLLFCLMMGIVVCLVLAYDANARWHLLSRTIGNSSGNPPHEEVQRAEKALPYLIAEVIVLGICGATLLSALLGLGYKKWRMLKVNKPEQETGS